MSPRRPVGLLDTSTVIPLARSDNAEQLPLSTVNPGDFQGITAPDLEPVDRPDGGE